MRDEKGLSSLLPGPVYAVVRGVVAVWASRSFSLVVGLFLREVWRVWEKEGRSKEAGGCW